MAGPTQLYDAVELQYQNRGQGASRNARGASSPHDVDIEAYPPQYQPRVTEDDEDDGYIEDGDDELKKGAYHSAPTHGRGSSWDLLSGGLKRFESKVDEFDTRNASQPFLSFAEGDMPKDKFSRMYNYLLNVSIVTRWLLFIIPVLAILWIPGILGLTSFPNAKVWGVPLMWWSSWLTCVWGGWWFAYAASRIVPSVARATIGLVAVGTRRYIDWLSILHRYVALFGWTLGIWIAFNPLILRHYTGSNAGYKTILNTMSKALCSFCLCAGLLVAEKLAIQVIAGKFHQRSYAERISEHKLAMKILTILYTRSSDIPTRSDTMRDGSNNKRGSMATSKVLLRKALKGVQAAATTTTTVLGNMASEMAGSRVLQPNSPEAKVETALSSPEKSRMLARRLFYSFVRKGQDHLVIDDLAKFFPTQEDAETAFAFFDKDGNGDVSRDEVDLACIECHRELLSIEHSMRDLDNAVGRLDDIFMTVYTIAAILLILVMLDMQLLTLVTAGGTLLLGLSWLIGGSLQEVLTSIIFLLVKHPFDVGDRVNMVDGNFTVKEIRLLSTIFLDSNGTTVQAPNMMLNQKFIQNYRRSPQMSEPYKFDVEYSTTFEQLENLRDKMLDFLSNQSRDFFPVFDVVVMDFPDQRKMTLKADIPYKSNLQHDALKATRHNKWMCALKAALEECEIYGIDGNPNKGPKVSRYTLVPWDNIESEDAQKKEKKERKEKEAEAEGRGIMPEEGWRLTGNNAAAADASEIIIFGDAQQLRASKTQRRTETGLRSRSTTQSSGPAVSSPLAINTGTMRGETEVMTPTTSTTKVRIFTREQR
ncbi:hypothetical protein JAAARDRAFT_41454 [Jaapia argillacea MUCL 33604]|uniref:EF-hand domain-containing protein n=1 Tax=Jaapia argillacea MUCL 33604 TaxID=933084 RepID=A0A067PL45_9AGAM|nr:hypothetical protein JAAARDRAFT_41454 [Jaapia argillacea MUCL 33604]